MDHHLAIWFLFYFFLVVAFIGTNYKFRKLKIRIHIDLYIEFLLIEIFFFIF